MRPILINRRRRRSGAGNPLSIVAPNFTLQTSAQPYNISAANSNLVAASDANAGGGDFTFTIAVTGAGSPTMTLTDLGGLDFTGGTGDGTADANMMFDCTVAEFNTAVDGATLQSGSYGAVNIIWQITDGTNTSITIQVATIIGTNTADAAWLTADNGTITADAA